MADIFSKEKRSAIMASIRSVSRLEQAFAKRLSAQVYPMGHRYRLNYKKVPGKPDIAFVSRKIAVFVDGDFWHGYQFAKKRHRLPNAFWITKIENNMRRDRRNRAALKKMGWTHIRIWEHDIRKRPDQCIEKIIKILNQPSSHLMSIDPKKLKTFDPEFRPQLSPKDMLELGIFGGIYLRDGAKEFPKDWFTHAKFVPKGIWKRDPKLNYFGVNASQPLSVWKQKGWISKHDPRGWFQWYCRYYVGRRIPDEDARQIKRWKAMRRHITQVANNCRPGDEFCRPRQRQALLHWAYDSRKI